MKLNSKLVVLALSLLLAASAFAGEMHKASLQTLSTVQVNGKDLPPGQYKLTWEGNGPHVQLSILKGKKVVATTDAQMVELQQKPISNAAVTSSKPDGSRSLDEIRFAGKKFAFAVGQNSRAQMKTGSNGSSGTN